MINSLNEFPVFDDCFSDLNLFVLELVQAYEAGKIGSWNDLEEKVRLHFTSARIAQMESTIPGWQQMASYSDGITLIHVMCAFLGLFMSSEFQDLTLQQQQLAKWIVLLHDIAKAHIRGKKDTMHAFRSGVQAAQILTRFGFPATKEYEQLIKPWSEYTAQAFITVDANIKPDNRKLPEILKGIDQLYGENTPAALIVKTILLHISLDVDPFYPTPAPLTEDEIKCFLEPRLFPLLKVMMLADNEGWSLFDLETRQQQRTDTLKSFQRFEKIIFT